VSPESRFLLGNRCFARSQSPDGHRTVPHPAPVPVDPATAGRVSSETRPVPGTPARPDRRPATRTPSWSTPATGGPARPGRTTRTPSICRVYAASSHTAIAPSIESHAGRTHTSGAPGSQPKRQATIPQAPTSWVTSNLTASSLTACANRAGWCKAAMSRDDPGTLTPQCSSEVSCLPSHGHPGTP
jgi:hypothetical protein